MPSNIVSVDIFNFYLLFLWGIGLIYKTMKKKAIFNWSGGKDSALALYKILQNQEYEIISLLTTVNSATDRSSMHAIPVSLLRKQAQSIGLPLYIVELAPTGEMVGYNQAMLKATEHFKALGVTHFIFGDIFLFDVRSYREKQLNPHGIEVVEPLWDKSTTQIMEEFLESGLKTIVVTTMANLLDENYVGRNIDEEFVKKLPKDIDICGENGEYHTFCYDGPIFNYPISYSLGKPFLVSNEVKMEDGTLQTFTYWYSNLNDI